MPPSSARAAIPPPPLVGVRPVKLSQLERLPNELLATIFKDSHLRKQDAIALGMASSFLWAFLIAIIETECKQMRGIWAGHEIACIGDYVFYTRPDLPAVSMYDNSYTHIARPGLYDGSRSSSPGWERFGVPETTEKDEEVPVAWRSAFERQSVAETAIPQVQIERMRTLLLSATPDFPIPSVHERWILRNLSVKEYVRCCPPSGERGAFVDHPDIEHVLLDNVLILGISCGFQWDHAERPAFTKARMGHSYDIIPTPKNISETSSGWKDVTDDVAKSIKNTEMACQSDLRTATFFRSGIFNYTDVSS